MMKRGQAAMEFLMTYSWAILVVLAAISALAYFGVLSPSRFLPEKCSLPSGLACLDSTLSEASGATLVIQNSLGVDLTNVSVTLNGTSCLNQGSGGSVTLVNSAKANFAVSGCRPAQNVKFKGTLSVLYTNADTGLAHVAIGELIKTSAP